MDTSTTTKPRLNRGGNMLEVAARTVAQDVVGRVRNGI